jgi:hypothetical protein
MNYWTCSKFADWIRGTCKPLAADGKGWRDWKDAAKKSHPVRYWIAEEGLDYIQNFVNWPMDQIRNVKYYINNRWVDTTHALTAHKDQLPRGQWCDLGYRFLPCLFNELVDFVEVEQAWMHIICDDDAQKKYGAPNRLTGWSKWRSSEAGLAYLTWAEGLTVDGSMGANQTDPDYGKPTGQAVAAKEIKELYLWWKNVYPNRRDPYEASGWSAICARRREKTGIDGILWSDRSPDERDETQKSLDMIAEMQKANEAEDELMMIRLIKIRNALWT